MGGGGHEVAGWVRKMGGGSGGLRSVWRGSQRVGVEGYRRGRGWGRGLEVGGDRRESGWSQLLRHRGGVAASGTADRGRAGEGRVGEDEDTVDPWCGHRGSSQGRPLGSRQGSRLGRWWWWLVGGCGGLRRTWVASPEGFVRRMGRWRQLVGRGWAAQWSSGVSVVMRMLAACDRFYLFIIISITYGGSAVAMAACDFFRRLGIGIEIRVWSRETQVGAMDCRG